MVHRAVRVSGKSQQWTRSIHPATYDKGALIMSPLWSGQGNSNPLRYSCLETSNNEGAWWAKIHAVTKSRTQLNDERFHFLSPLWRLGNQGVKTSKQVTQGIMVCQCRG